MLIASRLRPVVSIGKKVRATANDDLLFSREHLTPGDFLSFASCSCAQKVARRFLRAIRIGSCKASLCLLCSRNVGCSHRDIFLYTFRRKNALYKFDDTRFGKRNLLDEKHA